ncbi:uncharacterized protein LOC135828588 [Sycon ciliatum]|uniref:uncharacterized protein LOC135828588 n=1 Tax=Sycon ciliatum TaxID=27933 RepID=UPI0031F61468
MEQRRQSASLDLVDCPDMVLEDVTSHFSAACELAPAATVTSPGTTAPAPPSSPPLPMLACCEQSQYGGSRQDGLVPGSPSRVQSSRRRMAQHFLSDLDSLLQAEHETGQAIRLAEAALTRLKISTPGKMRSASVDHGQLVPSQTLLSGRARLCGIIGSSASLCHDCNDADVDDDEDEEFDEEIDNSIPVGDAGYASGAASPELRRSVQLPLPVVNCHASIRVCSCTRTRCVCSSHDHTQGKYSPMRTRSASQTREQHEQDNSASDSEMRRLRQQQSPLDHHKPLNLGLEHQVACPSFDTVPPSPCIPLHAVSDDDGQCAVCSNASRKTHNIACGGTMTTPLAVPTEASSHPRSPSSRSHDLLRIAYQSQAEAVQPSQDSLLPVLAKCDIRDGNDQPLTTLTVRYRASAQSAQSHSNAAGQQCYHAPGVRGIHMQHKPQSRLTSCESQGNVAAVAGVGRPPKAKMNVTIQPFAADQTPATCTVPLPSACPAAAVVTPVTRPTGPTGSAGK